MLDSYINHVSSSGNRSILARIYGLFSIQTNVFGPLDVIVMQNTAHVLNSKKKQFQFDLKGSTAGRYTHFDQKQKWHLNSSCSSVLKDLNFLEINKAVPSLMKFSDLQQTTISETIEEDIKFLCLKGLMDYSLLLTIE